MTLFIEVFALVFQRTQALRHFFLLLVHVAFFGLHAVLLFFEFAELVAEFVFLRLDAGRALLDLRIVLLLHLDEALLCLKNFLLFDVFALLLSFGEDFVLLA